MNTWEQNKKQQNAQAPQARGLVGWNNTPTPITKPTPAVIPTSSTGNSWQQQLESAAQSAKEVDEYRKRGDEAGAMGAELRGMAKAVGNAAYDGLELALTPVFMGIDGGTRFAKGLVGWNDTPTQTAPQTTPPTTQSAPTQPAAQKAVQPAAQPTARPTQAAVQPTAQPAAQPTPRVLTAQAPADSPYTPEKLGLTAPKYTRGQPSIHTPPPREQLAQDKGLLGFAPNLAANLPDFNQQPERPFVATLGGTPDTAQRDKLLQAALTPHKGAQNGQLTANQLNTARGILESEQQNQLELQKAQEQLTNNAAIAQANNVNALQRDWLQQQGGLQRDVLSQNAAMERELVNQAGQMQRQAQSNAQEQARLDENARQFNLNHLLGLPDQQLKAAKAAREQALQARTDKLRERLINTTDEKERAKIWRELSILGGEQPDSGFNKDNFMKIQRNVTGADGMSTTQDDVIDLRNGQSILDGSAGYLKVGQVIDGMRFKGGNPQDKANWERVNG